MSQWREQSKRGDAFMKAAAEVPVGPMTDEKRKAQRAALMVFVKERIDDAERWLRMYDALDDGLRADYPEIPSIFDGLSGGQGSAFWIAMGKKRRRVEEQLAFDTLLAEMLPDEWEAEDMARTMYSRAGGELTGQVP